MNVKIVLRRKPSPGGSLYSNYKFYLFIYLFLFIIILNDQT